MERVNFLDNRSYIDHDPRGILIYCDPPYTNSKFDKRMSNLFGFDTLQFWETMRLWSRDNTVIVSERSAPGDFKSIFSITRSNPFNGNDLVEHLFVYDG